MTAEVVVARAQPHGFRQPVSERRPEQQRIVFADVVGKPAVDEKARGEPIPDRVVDATALTGWLEAAPEAEDWAGQAAASVFSRLE